MSYQGFYAGLQDWGKVILLHNETTWFIGKNKYQTQKIIMSF